MEIVIFDTNAYRDLTTDPNFSELPGDVENFKALEKANDITAMMHPIVIKELLYHVAGERDNMHKKALKALFAMFVHCGDSEKFMMLADFDLQISNYYYGVRDPNRERIDLQLGQIVAALATHGVEHVLQKYQFNLKQIREYIANTEAFFKAQLKAFLHKIDPAIDDWTVFAHDDSLRRRALAYFTSDDIENEIAIGYISLTHDHLLAGGLIPGDTHAQILAKATHFKTVFKAPITLYKEVLKKFTQPDFDFEKKSRENFVWDIHLMFTLGNHVVSAANAGIVVVTTDGEIIQAAKNSGFHTKVYSFKEYVEVITGRQAAYEANKGNEAGD